jgi:hypothetical protein
MGIKRRRILSRDNKYKFIFVTKCNIQKLFQNNSHFDLNKSQFSLFLRNNFLGAFCPQGKLSFWKLKKSAEPLINSWPSYSEVNDWMNQKTMTNFVAVIGQIFFTTFLIFERDTTNLTFVGNVKKYKISL